jgi:hypothetical protein
MEGAEKERKGTVDVALRGEGQGSGSVLEANK